MKYYSTTCSLLVHISCIINVYPLYLRKSYILFFYSPKLVSLQRAFANPVSHMVHKRHEVTTTLVVHGSCHHKRHSCPWENAADCWEVQVHRSPEVPLTICWLYSLSCRAATYIISTREVERQKVVEDVDILLQEAAEDDQVNLQRKQNTNLKCNSTLRQ